MNEIINSLGLDTVPDDTKIARYFSGEKLTQILNSQKIWFSNTKKFHDKRERKIPLGFFKGWKNEDKERYLSMYDMKCVKINAFVSCWSEFKAENYALWKIYDEHYNGACLVTSVGKLKAALKRTDLILCKVEYVSFKSKEKIDLPWVTYNWDEVPSTMRVTEKYKIEPYKYEEEIRGIIYSTSDENGFGIEVDIINLIDEVYISPFSNEKQIEKTLKKLMKKFDKSKIKNSEILEI